MLNVLVLSSTASAINYKNSLANDQECRLFFTDVSRYAAGLYDERIIPLLIPPARDHDNYRQALDRIIETHQIDVLIPTSDHDMEGVATLLTKGWNPRVKMFRFDTGKFFLYTNKKKLARKVEELGYVSARLFKKGEQVDLPVVIKPTREGGGKGVWIVDNESDYREKLALVQQQYGDDLVVQEFIPGGTGSIFVVLLLFGQDGELYGEAVTRSSLTFMTWGGGGNAGCIVDKPDLLAYAKVILHSLGGWQGPINMEFKQHSENGKYYLMEINCRLNGYSYLTTMNGLNFPRAIIDLLVHGTTKNISPADIKERKNFILSYRETIVNDWASTPVLNQP